MTEPTDAIVPVLQPIQADLVRLGAKLDGNTDVLVRQADKLDAIETDITFSMGRIAQGRVDIDGLVADVADLNHRRDVLEHR